MHRIILLIGLGLGLGAVLPAAVTVPAPAALSATATGLSGQVSLAWSAVSTSFNAQVTGYRVYHNSVSSVSGALSFYVPGTVTAVSGLSDRVKRWFFVAGEDGAYGLGTTGTAASATPFQGPDAVTVTAQLLPVGTNVALSWTASTAYGTGVGSYRVEAKTAAGTSVLANLAATVFSTTVTAVCGTGVSLSVRAFDAFGSSGAASAPRYFELPCAPLLTVKDVSSGQLNLSWNSGAFAGSWEIRTATAAALADTLTALVALTTSASASIAAPAQGQALYVRIRAVSPQFQTSTASNEGAMLIPPTDLRAGAQKGKVVLQWSTPGIITATTQGIASYKVFYSSTSSDPSSAPGHITLTATVNPLTAAQSLTISPLTDHAVHWFQLAALSGGQEGPRSLTVSALPALPTPIFSVAASLTSGALSLVWGAVDAGSATPVAYSVYRATDAFLSAPVLLTTTSALNLTATPSAGTVGYYYISVVDSSGSTSAATPASAVLALPALDAPVLAVASTGNARVRLTWTAVSNASSYAVYRATGSGYQLLPGGVLSGRDFTDTAPVNSGFNSYQVIAQAASGVGNGLLMGPASNAVAVTPTVAPGIPGRYGVSSSLSDLAYLTAVARADGGTDLLWAAAGAGSFSLSGYHVWRGWSAQSLTDAAFVAVSVTAYRDPLALQPQGDLVYGVTAEDLKGVLGPRLTGSARSAVLWPAPQLLKATVLSGGVRLSWAPSAGSGSYPLSSYALSRRWVSGGPYDLLADLSGTAYVDLAPDAAQGSQPSYKVQVRDTERVLGAGVTLTAVIATVTVTPGLPSPVSGVAAVAQALSGTPALITWRPNPQSELVTGYKVYAGVSLLTQTAGLSWTDSPTALGSTVDYSVQAVNAQGDGVSGTALPLYIAPPQPAVVSATTSVNPLRQGLGLGLIVSWTNLSATALIDGYEVYAQDGAFTGVTNAAYLGFMTATGFEDSAITPGVARSYAVLARAGGVTVLTPSAQLQSFNVPPAPGALSGLTASASKLGVALSWNSDPAAVEYWVWRATYALDAQPPAPPTARVPVPSYLDGAGLSKLALNYAVCSVNGLGRAAASLVSLAPAAGKPGSISLVPGYVSPNASVDLSWGAETPSNSVTGYEIWRATDASVLPYGGSDLGSAAGTFFSDTTTALNTDYYYAVVGLGFSDGVPRGAGPVRVYGPASAPVNVQASGASGAVDFSWSAPNALEGVTGWALSLDIDGIPSSHQLPVASTVYRADNLVPGSLATLSVQALNSAGASPSSASASAQANTVGAAQVPTLFKAVTGFSGLSTQGKVELSWSAPGAGTVLLYGWPSPMSLSLAAGGPSSAYYLTGVPASFAAITFTSTDLGQSYDFALSAVSSDGLPLGESAARMLTAVPIRRSATLPGLSGTAGDGRVDLVWSVSGEGGSAGAAAKPFRLHRQLGGISAPNLSALVDDAGFPLDLSGSAYSDLSVINGANYWYLMSVVDALGRESALASVARDRTGAVNPLQPQGPPQPPSPIIAVAGDKAVSLRWLASLATAVSGAKYNVYRRAVGSDYMGPVPELYGAGPSSNEFASLSYTVVTLRDLSSDLVNRTQYAYSVAAVNSWGEGPKSAEILVTPFAPLKPSTMAVGGGELGLSVIGKKDISLSWGAITQTDSGGYPFDFYRVYRSQDGGTTYSIVADGLAATAFVDNGTSFGAAYTYRVVPVDDRGNEGYSYNLKSVVIPPAVNSLLLFRNSFNPAVGEILPVQYALQQPGHVWVKVFTLNGEYVATLFNEEVPVASPDQPFLSDRKSWDGRTSDGQLVASGVYLLHMEGPSFRQNSRVAVIK